MQVVELKIRVSNLFFYNSSDFGGWPLRYNTIY